MYAGAPLVPQPRIWLRLAILAALIALAFIGPNHWFAMFVFILAACALLGTFPRCSVDATNFKRQWFIFFVPAISQTTPLARVYQIETDVESHMSTETGCAVTLLFGLEHALLIWLSDWLIPWLGGDYKIWLRLGSDLRVLAWQGNGENNFRENLEILEEISELPVTRG